MTPPELDRKSALFLDFDGTLVEIAATPDQVMVPPGLPDLLAQLYRQLGGALAIVSGRPLAQTDELLRPFSASGAGRGSRNCPSGVMSRTLPSKLLPSKVVR